MDALAGRGAMGAVFRAHDSRLDRIVALKLIASPDQPDAHARFEREARVLASLDHRHIAKIYEVGTEGESRYLALEWIEGESLGDRMFRGDMTFGEKRRVLRAVAEALDHAHRSGVLHRDIKPANVMLGPGGVVKVVDFGIAKPIRPDGEKSTFATEEGVALGTPRYMSPEQHDLEPASASTDQFAWAVLAYELLSGAPPPLATTNGVFPFHRPPPLPPNLPTALAAVVDRAISPKSRDRYPSMGELVVALRKTDSRRRGRPLFAISAAATLLLGLGLVAVLWRAPEKKTPLVAAPAPFDAADTPITIASTPEPESVPIDASMPLPARPPRRRSRAANRCECWNRSGRLCATAFSKPKCGCWWDPPSGWKDIGCPVDRATLPNHRCSSYLVEGRAGDGCRTFISQSEDRPDIEVTGKLECTMCASELVATVESGTKSGQPCRGVSDSDGRLEDGTWDCGF